MSREQQIKRLQKLVEIDADPKSVLLDLVDLVDAELPVLSQKMDELDEFVQDAVAMKIDGEDGDIGPQGPQGERGEKGEKGDTGPMGPQGPKGDKGDPGLDGRDGLDGIDGKDGVDGKDGKDGSPDTPEQVRDKLQSLRGDSLLDAKFIKNLPQPIIQNITRGTATPPLQILDNGTPVTSLTKKINFIGGTITGGGENITIDVTGYLDQDEGDARYLNEASNLSDLDNVATARTNLGLVAGGAGDIWVEKAGDTMTGQLINTVSVLTPELIGSTASGGSLTLTSTSNATKGPINIGESLVVSADGSAPGSTSNSILLFRNGDRIYSQDSGGNPDRMFYTSDRFEILSKSGAEFVVSFNSSGSANASRVVFYKGICSSSYSATAPPSDGAIFAGNVGVGTNSPAVRFHVASTSSTETMRLQGRSDFGSIQFYNSSGTRRGIIGYDSGGGFITQSLTNSLIIRGENGITFGDAAVQIASMFYDGSNRRMGIYGEAFLSFGHTTDITDPRSYIYWDETDDELTFLTDNSGGTPTEALKIDTSQRFETLSGVIGKVTEVTAATYTALATDHRISIQYTDTGAHTLTLPAISASNHGQKYLIKDADYNASVNNITVNPTGADTIEEQASGTMTGDGEAWTLVANNTTKNWELY